MPAMKYNFNPKIPKEASAFFKAKELKPSFDYQDVWGKEHATAFTVARTTQIDVLSDIYAALNAALDDGQTFETFKKNLEPILKSKGWWGIKEQTDPQTGEVKKVKLGTPRRLKTIFWANMSSARSAGQWERAQRTKAALPYFIYTQTSSADPRPEHLTWVGTILPIDHEWWHTHFPANGWGCNCGVRQISKYEAQRLGGVTKPINYPPKAFRRKLPNGDYEIINVPGGIDPGWDSNPGRARMSEIKKAQSRAISKAQAENMPENLIKSILSGQKIATSKEVDKWITNVIDGGKVAKNENTIAIDLLSDGLKSDFEAMGIEVNSKTIGLDYSLLRHIWKNHGGSKDKNISQVPLTKIELLKIAELINQSKFRKSDATPSARFRGKPPNRFIADLKLNGHIYTICIEMRAKHIVPVTLYKRKI